MKGANCMKRYKLLKDLPFAKAGEELYLKFSEDSEFFLVYKGTDKAYTAELNPEFIDNFSEWLEEIEETKTFFLICDIYYTALEDNTKSREDWQIKNLKSIGNYFETKEDAEKCIAYLKAKVVLKQDTGGFEPDWEDMGELKYYGYWDCNVDEVDLGYTYADRTSDIYFQSEKDIKESFKKHPKEWRTYLTYEG